MKKIKTERLQRFAEYLTTQDFVSADYFSPLPQLVYVDDHGSPIPVNPVLFLALFEMPHIFPESWAYNNQFEPILKNSGCSNPLDSVMAWFGLSDLQAEHLFFQGMQLCHRFGGKLLDEKSTKHDLALNTLELIKASENETHEFLICLN